MNTFNYAAKSTDTDFTEALAGATGAMVPPYTATSMVLMRGLPAIGSRWFNIVAIEVTAMENFGPELNFFSSAAGLTTDPFTDTFLARFPFISANGEQVGGSGLWRYYVDGLSIPVFDADTIGTQNPPNLHIVMQNIDTTAKSANAPGAVQVTVWVRPMQAF